MLSACINAEEAAHGIRSCVVAPGDIDTELLDRRPHPPSPEQRARMLQPDDVAQLIVSIVQQPDRALVELVQVRPSPSSQRAESDDLAAH
jgi:NADP-dependent 3-hydroxy acid dehydrogenase YdfG